MGDVCFQPQASMFCACRGPCVYRSSRVAPGSALPAAEARPAGVPASAGETAGGAGSPREERSCVSPPWLRPQAREGRRLPTATLASLCPVGLPAWLAKHTHVLICSVRPSRPSLPLFASQCAPPGALSAFPRAPSCRPAVLSSGPGVALSSERGPRFPKGRSLRVRHGSRKAALVATEAISPGLSAPGASQTLTHIAFGHCRFPEHPI